MARIAAKATVKSSGQHETANIADPSTTGDVVLAFDAAVVKTNGQLRAIVETLLFQISGSNALKP